MFVHSTASEIPIACQCHGLEPNEQSFSSAEKHSSNAGAQLRLASLMVRLSLLVTGQVQVQVQSKHLALSKPTAMATATAAAVMRQMHKV